LIKNQFTQEYMSLNLLSLRAHVFKNLFFPEVSEFKKMSFTFLKIKEI